MPPGRVPSTALLWPAAMAAVTFTAADVARMLGLPDTIGVDDLVRSGALVVNAYSLRGRPLFNCEAVCRAAARLVAQAHARAGHPVGTRTS
jgi:hypothetical protein